LILQEIGENAFWVSSLKSMIRPAFVEVMDRNAIAWCKSFMSVIFEAGSALQQIAHLGAFGDYAFPSRWPSGLHRLRERQRQQKGIVWPSNFSSWNVTRRNISIRLHLNLQGLRE
jgi:hypothetical protein